MPTQWWIAESVVQYETGETKYFDKDGKEMPYPWILLDNDEEVSDNT